MNKVQTKRLLNVARALREAHAAKKKFTMDKWVFGDEGAIEQTYDEQKDRYVSCNTEKNFCGTPACALGHYASRTDLQRILKVSLLKDDAGTTYASMDTFGQPAGSDWDQDEVQAHFGIDSNEFYDLFDMEGCGGATTALQAAKHIENFVKQKQFPGRDVNKTNDDFYY